MRYDPITMSKYSRLTRRVLELDATRHCDPRSVGQSDFLIPINRKLQSLTTATTWGPIRPVLQRHSL